MWERVNKLKVKEETVLGTVDRYVLQPIRADTFFCRPEKHNSLKKMLKKENLNSRRNDGTIFSFWRQT